MVLGCACLTLGSTGPASAQASHSWVVTYTSNGTWSEDNFTNGNNSIQATALPGTWDTGANGNNCGGQYSVDATTQGTVTATCKWVPTAGETLMQDPPPPQVIVQETASASASGGAGTGPPYESNGLGPDQSDTMYVLKDGTSGTITLTDALSASTPSAGPPPYRGGRAQADVLFTVTANTVEVELAGVTTDTDGYSLDILTGQQVTASLAAPYTVVAGSQLWTTAASDAFEDYITTSTTGQLVALSGADMTAPFFSFYTKATEQAKVTGSAQLMCPDGTLLNVTASRALNSERPTATWEVDGPDSPFQHGYQITAGPPPQVAAQVVWWPAVITVPASFSGGTGCFAQTATLTKTNTRTPTAGTNALATYINEIQVGDTNPIWEPTPAGSLDNGFPYPFGYDPVTYAKVTTSYTWDAGQAGYSGDSPNVLDIPPLVTDLTPPDNGGTDWIRTDVNESFQSWVMYRPSAVANQGTVYVPLKQLAWSWSFTNAGKEIADWAHYDAETFVPGSPADSATPPQWSSNTVGNVGEEQRPGPRP